MIRLNIVYFSKSFLNNGVQLNVLSPYSLYEREARHNCKFTSLIFGASKLPIYMRYVWFVVTLFADDFGINAYTPIYTSHSYDS